MKISELFKPQNLTDGPILKNMVRFAVPVLFSCMFQMLYNTVDTIIIGHTLGSTALAAAGSAAAVYELLLSFIMGLSDGLTLSVAHKVGAGGSNLRKAVASAVKMGLIVIAAVSLLMFFTLRPFLKLLNTPDNLLELAYEYTSVIVIFLFVQFFYNVCAGILRATGNSIVPVLFLLAATVVNVVLDLLFITKFNMGLAGAAIATVIAQCVSVLCFAVYILRKERRLIPQLSDFKFGHFDLTNLGQGLSLAIMNSIVFAGTAILQTGINGLGTLIIAGHTTARKITSFVSMPFSALNTTIYNFSAQNHGASRPDRIRRALFYCYIIDAVVAALTITMYILWAENLVTLVSGSVEEELVANASRYLCISGAFNLVLGVLTETRCATQAIGKKVVPLLSSIIELVGKVLFVVLFVPVWGYNAVIWCEPIIWCFMTAELVPTFWLCKEIRSR